MNSDDELQHFAKKLIKTVRDQSIELFFNILNGNGKSLISKNISKQLAEISDSELESIKDLISYAVDGTLNNFLYMIEQEDDFDIVSCKDGEQLSLKDSSDGLSVDYWNFVDDYSTYECKNL